MRTATASIAAYFGGLPARFWWLWAGAILSAFATFVFLFLAVYLGARGFSPREIGLLVSADGLGSLAAAPFGGWLADRLGRRPTLLLALAVTAAAAVFLGLVRAPALVVAGVLVFGLGSTMTFPALSAIIADIVPERDLERAFGLLYWANNLGVAFSAAVGGAIGERSWLGLFLADAATTVAFAAIVWRHVPETRPAATPPAGGAGAATAAGPARGYGAVLRDWGSPLPRGTSRSARRAGAAGARLSCRDERPRACEPAAMPLPACGTPTTSRIGAGSGMLRSSEVQRKVISRAVLR